MKNALKTASLCAFLWIAFKLVGYKLMWNTPQYAPFFVMANMFVLLVAVAVTLYFYNRETREDDSLLNDIKNGMLSGTIYALLISIFLYFYYEKIDPQYNEKMIFERELYMKKILESPEKLAELKASNQDLEVMTVEEILEKYKEMPQILFSGTFMMTYGLLALVTLSALYSTIVAVIYKKILFR